MKFISLLLVCALVVSLLFCACVPTPEPGPDTPDDPTDDPQKPSEDDDPDDPEGPEDPVIDDKTIDNINKTLDAIDSVARAVDMTSTAYINADDSFFWITMYYFCANFASQHPHTHLVEGTNERRVPSAVMLEFGHACFSELADLPAIPGDMQIFTYDPLWDAYVFEDVDAMGYIAEIESLKRLDTGFELSVNCIGNDRTVVDSYRVNIIPNPDATDDYIYVYSISVMENIAD